MSLTPAVPMLRPAAPAEAGYGVEHIGHGGRRELIAAHLFVHPQTVRYRMAQLRELFGDRLDDPEEVLRLTMALALQPTRPPAP